MRAIASGWRRSSRHGDDGGFSRLELGVAMALIAVLAVIISFTLSSATKDAVRTDCASDVSLVDTAVATYSTQHEASSQLTIAELTADGGLSSWPTIANHAYAILIAGDGNQLVGALDARGVRVERNDILVRVGDRIYDATRSFASACASA